jgi:hypothetical protein
MLGQRLTREHGTRSERTLRGGPRPRRWIRVSHPGADAVPVASPPTLRRTRSNLIKPNPTESSLIQVNQTESNRSNLQSACFLPDHQVCGLEAQAGSQRGQKKRGAAPGPGAFAIDEPARRG